jgi:hypothetical protein
MGDTIFSDRWRPSIKNPASPFIRPLPVPYPHWFHGLPWYGRLLLSPPRRFILILAGLLLWALPATPEVSVERSDREEEGLKGPVRSVETRESLLVQTDWFDPQGRLIERLQHGIETSQGLWPLRFVYSYDQAGRRTAETVHDARGELVKETRFAHDEYGHRSAEVATWSDGTFENASLYEYDEAHRLIRGLHYNAQQVINRNLYTFDGAGRLARERFERNYGYDARGRQVMKSDRFNIGYELVMRYDDQVRIRDKAVFDLAGLAQGRSAFQYDEHGNQKEERIFNAEGRATDRKAYRYEYDDMGNWILEALQWWAVRDGRETLKQFQIRERSLTYHPFP